MASNKQLEDSTSQLRRVFDLGARAWPCQHAVAQIVKDQWL